MKTYTPAQMEDKVESLPKNEKFRLIRKGMEYMVQHEEKPLTKCVYLVMGYEQNEKGLWYKPKTPNNDQRSI